MNLDIRLALAINRLAPLRALEKAMLADVVDSAEFYLTLSRQTLESIIGRKFRSEPALPEMTLRVAEHDERFCRERNVRIVPIWDEAYPPALREIYDPPFLLFVRGALPDPRLPAVAVVGTREPSAAASVASTELCEELARCSVPVVSGLARGIDSAAHRGALESLVSGATGAVLGCGIDRICPLSNRSLALRMLDQGGWVMSEYSPGTPSAKYHFPARNRIISGMSRGVVVIEAPAHSGALITAEYALDQGRDLFVHRDGLSGATGAGTRELADDGARIITHASDIFEEWGVVPERHELSRHPEASRRGAAPDSSGAGAQLASELRAMLSEEAERA